MTHRPADTMPGPGEMLSGATGQMNNEPGSPPLHREGGDFISDELELHNRIAQRLQWLEQGTSVSVAEFVADVRSLLSQARVGAEPSAVGPAELWLQLHGDCHESELSEPVDYTGGDVTWCWHPIHDTDVRYVRADLAASPKEQPVQPTAGWTTFDTHTAHEASGLPKLPASITWTALHKFAQAVAAATQPTDAHPPRGKSIVDTGWSDAARASHEAARAASSPPVQPTDREQLAILRRYVELAANNDALRLIDKLLDAAATQPNAGRAAAGVKKDGNA